MSANANRGSRKRARWIRRPLLGAALLVIVASAVLAACGASDGGETAFTPAAGHDSAYCDTYWGWQAFKVDGGSGDDERSPAAFRAWWNEYLIFNETALKQAPPVIHDEWVLKMGGLRTRLTPLLEKYNFDVKRMGREGTLAEQASSEPSPDEQKAEDAINAWEDRVCGAVTAPAADVVFKADGSSKAYCAALGTLNSGFFEKGESSGFDPDALRSIFTADGFTEALAGVEKTAPAEIAADVEAEAEWLRTLWLDVFAEFDYDIRRIYLDGTPEDRAVLTLSHPDVVEHSSRVTAYEDQVCDA